MHDLSARAQTTAVSRRRILQAGTAAAGAGLAALALPRSVQRVLASTDAAGTGKLSDVEHVVILIQENRSFDHYFGTLSSVRGFDDPTALPGVFRQQDVKSADGFMLPWHADTSSTSAQCIADTSHAWPVQHAAWNNGAMDRWLPAHRAADGDTNGPLTMAYMTRSDIPYYYALADAFTICDNYHCSVFGPTNPNRVVSMSATIDPGGTGGGPVVDNSSTGFTWTTYPEQLQARGITWRVFDEGNGDSVLPLFTKYQDQSSVYYQQGAATVPPGTFEAMAAAGQLPQVSWVLGPIGTDEHPSSPPALGEDLVSRILTALTANSSAWAKTVLFVTYDENDGFFDHVAPPTPPPGTAGEYLTVDPLPAAAGGVVGPVGLGFRVPMMVISPFSRGGWVCSDVFDHTSTLRFLETRFGAEVPNLSAWRRSVTGDLTTAFNWDTDTSVPSLPATQSEYASTAQSCASSTAPAPPASQSMPHQETSPVRRSTTQPPADLPDLGLPAAALVVGAALAGLRHRARVTEASRG